MVQLLLEEDPSRRKAGLLARTNYSYEKRQREIAKKKKKEQKRLLKEARKAARDGQPPEATETPPDQESWTR